MNKSRQSYLARKQLLERYSIGNTTLYRWINDPKVAFPKPIQLGSRCVRWALADIEAWEANRKGEAA